MNFKKKDYCKIRKKEKIRDRYNQVSHQTQDTMGENHKTREYHNILESHKVSHFTTGDRKAARNIQESMTRTNKKLTKRIHNKSTPLELSLSKELGWGLNVLNGTSRTLSSDQDQRHIWLSY